MIIATTTESETDEDTESGSRVTRSIIDSFMKRPSLEDRAIRTISVMANNDLFMMRGEDEKAPLFDAAIVFLDRNQARFLISGRSAAFHFENGALKHRSLSGAANMIGSGLRYEPRLEPVFELRQEKNAFLTASPSLVEAVSEKELEDTLRESNTPEEWMRKLRDLAGTNKEFCAITAFLPVTRPGLFDILLGRHSAAPSAQRR